MHKIVFILFSFFSVFGLKSQLQLAKKSEIFLSEQNMQWIPDVMGNILFFEGNQLYKGQNGQLPNFSQSIKSIGEISQLLPINAFKTILFSRDQQQVCILDNTFSPNGNCTDLDEFNIQNAKFTATSARPNLLYVFDAFNSSLYTIDLMLKSTAQSVLNIRALVGKDLVVKALKEHNNQLFMLTEDASVFVFDMFLNLKGQLKTPYESLTFWNNYIVRLNENNLDFLSLENNAVSYRIQCPIADGLKIHGNSFYFSKEGVISTYELKDN